MCDTEKLGGSAGNEASSVGCIEDAKPLENDSKVYKDAVGLLECKLYKWALVDKDTEQQVEPPTSCTHMHHYLLGKHSYTSR